MPTISQFFGIIIQMFWNDHAPPHFHCQYGEHEAIVDIRTFEIIEGKLPRRAMNLVLDWAELHQAELIENWNLCETKQQPKPIAPLE